MRRWSYAFLAGVAILLVGCTPRPFSSSSPWNTPIGAVAWRDAPELRAGHSWVNDESFSIPVVRSGGADPLVAVSVPASWGWPGGVVQVNIPPGVTGAAGSDATLVVVSGGMVFDFYGFNRTGPNRGTASAWAASNHDAGSGWGRPSPFLGGGVRATGASALGGLITSGDIIGGDDFRHALAVSLLNSELASGYTAPAISGGGGTGSIPMGARLGIPAGTPMPGGLSPIGVRMWNTLVRYGAYVVDQHGGSAPVVFSADPRSVSVDTVAPLRAPGGDLDRIMPAVRVVQ